MTILIYTYSIYIPCPDHASIYYKYIVDLYLYMMYIHYPVIDSHTLFFSPIIEGIHF